MILGTIWIISSIYIIYKMIKSNERKSLDGVHGTTPGFDAIVFICGAPFFALVDLGLSWFSYIKYKK